MSNPSDASASSRIQLGVSACLVGQRVRYDGGDRQDRCVTAILGRLFQLIPLCPEVAIGLGTPRPPIRLQGAPDNPAAVTADDPPLDVGESLRAYGRRTADRLDGISGYIFKSRSPSCGVYGVKIHDHAGRAWAHGTGIYAREIMRALPMLPVEEEGRLNEPAIRENFLERVFAYRRWQQLHANGLTTDALLRFHSAHELTVMAHGRQQPRALERLLVNLEDRPIEQTAAAYGSAFMQAMRRKATRRRHADVLLHLAGYLKHKLNRDDQTELTDAIDAYRRGRLSLIAPLTLLRDHFRRHPHPYVEQQVYLRWPPPRLIGVDDLNPHWGGCRISCAGGQRLPAVGGIGSLPPAARRR